MNARWGKGVDRALEAVERMRAALHRELKRFVVVVTAGLALGHGIPVVVDLHALYPKAAATGMPVVSSPVSSS